MESIDSFSGDYRWLSNFWLVPIRFVLFTFPSVENAYQAAKTDDLDKKKYIESLSPGKAKRYGAELELPKNWEDIKFQYMHDLIRMKFEDAELKEKLLATGNAELIEGNDWGDSYWGVCDGKGHNYLGRILMSVRDEIKI